MLRAAARLPLLLLLLSALQAPPGTLGQSKQPLACEQSGYCSVGLVSTFNGDIAAGELTMHSRPPMCTHFACMHGLGPRSVWCTTLQARLPPPARGEGEEQGCFSKGWEGGYVLPSTHALAT